MRKDTAMGLPKNATSIKLERAEEFFEEIYVKKHWSHGDGSGKDSEPRVVEEFFPVLTDILTRHEVETFVDYGCGSHFVFSEYDFPENVSYKGYDASSTALERAVKNARRSDFEFEVMGDWRNLSEGGDMIMVKDVTCHWQKDLVMEFIEHCRPLFKHILIVGDRRITEFDEMLEMCKETHFVKKDKNYGIYML